MMDRIALAKSSARCWERLGRAFSREADRLASQWETLGEEPGRRALDACEAAHFEAEFALDRGERAVLVF